MDECLKPLYRIFSIYALLFFTTTFIIQPEFIANSIEYAVRLFSIVDISFKIFSKYRKHEPCGSLFKQYDCAWERYMELEKRPQATSAYTDKYYFAENGSGLSETIEMCRSGKY